MIAPASKPIAPARVQQAALLELCRWAFTPDEHESLGRLYPQGCAVAPFTFSSMQTECILEPKRATVRLDVRVRFWQSVQPLHAGSSLTPSPWVPIRGGVDLVEERGMATRSSRQALCRQINLSSVWLPGDRSCSLERAFAFPPTQKLEVIADGNGGVTGTERFCGAEICGFVELQGRPVGDGLLKVRVRIVNQTPVPRTELGDHNAVLLRSFDSTHTIIHTEDGEFHSLARPNGYMDQAAGCENYGTWPVLVGDAELGERHTILSSAEVYEDYPCLPAGFLSKPAVDGVLCVNFPEENEAGELPLAAGLVRTAARVAHG